MTEKDKSHFGGKYGFIQRIKLGGIGSPKVIYKSGIPHFDELKNQIAESEIPFVNFELMKNGLLIRLNHNLKTRYVGIQLLEYKGVTFQKEFGRLHSMELRTLNDGFFYFEIHIANLSAIQTFFKKRSFLKG